MNELRTISEIDYSFRKDGMIKESILIAIALTLFALGKVSFAGDLSLGKHLSIEWNTAEELSIQYISQTKFFLLTPKADQKTYKVFIQRNILNYPVKSEIVNLEWDQYLASEVKSALKIEDNGCEEVGKRRYQCSRSAKLGNQSLAEHMIFTEFGEKILLRVQSESKEISAKEILSEFRVRLKK